MGKKKKDSESPKKPPTASVGFRVPEDVKDVLEEMARKRHMDMAGFLYDLVERGLEDLEDEDKLIQMYREERNRYREQARRDSIHRAMQSDIGKDSPDSGPQERDPHEADS